MEYTSAIQCQGLAKSFGGTTALADITLDCPKGELFGLVGPDGAGKTTLMRILSGVMDPSGGEAQVAGCHVTKNSEELRRRIGYMSQRFGLYPDLTVVENIQFYADIYGVSRRDRLERMERLLAFSNMAPFQRRLAGNLSGGMKQKLGLVCALIHTPEVLFLDEPTNGVDPVSRRDLWRILYQLLRDRVTIFVSTAYLDEAERCARIGLLHQGRLVSLGTPEKIKESVRDGLLEVVCARPREAVHVFRHAIPGATFGLFGDRLHAYLADRERLHAAILRIGGEHDLGIELVQPAEATLEDVFVALLGGGSRDAA